MSGIPLFAPIFKSYSSNPNHLDVSNVHAARRKRKRGQSESSSSSYGYLSSDESDVTHQDLKPEQIAQYLVAGQPSNKELPSLHFPHYAQKTPPNSVWRAAKVDTGMRKQHVAVLTALLHRCMLAGDYIRAGRAWGMLLKVEVEGRQVDLRTDGKWGIGAEILLFRDSLLADKQARLEDQGKNIPEKTYQTNCPSRRARDASFSESGFSKAKDYYERLILQYPYRKVAPNAVSSIDFYPAMLGLWLYAVQEQSRMKSSDSTKVHDIEDRPEGGRDTDATIRMQELEQLAEITARMDELLVAPPYSDHAELWRLRGMVAVWEADLMQLRAVSAPDQAVLPGDEEQEVSLGASHQFRERLLAAKTFEAMSKLG